MSNYLEAALIDTLFRSGGNFTAPADIYIGLATATLSDASTGASMSEQTGTDYARVDTGGPADGAWDDPGATSGATANTSAVTFTAAGAADWTDVTDMAILNAVTSGDLLFYTPLTVTPVAIGDGDTPNFAAGAITITLA